MPKSQIISVQHLVDELVGTLKSGGHRYLTEAEIVKIERKLQISVSILRGTRNSLQKIHRLPREILTTILLDVQQTIPSFIPEREEDPFFHSEWMSLLHVCRHWRGIIATCPMFWTRVDSGLMPGKFLQRSQSADIDVYLGYNQRGPFTSELMDKLVPNIGRLRELHLDVSEWDGTTDLFSQLNVSAPKLRSMTIISDKSPFHFAGPGTEVLPSIFNGEMPSLKMLLLTHYTRWPSGYFQNLTHLCLLDQCDTQPNSRPSTSEFLDFLEMSLSWNILSFEEQVLPDRKITIFLSRVPIA
ncbi:hypothetical protein K435DRAFT_210895 [Dendrothele bispora CBS 962.96]|uniref:Uncharacterized protein n=1 Tax=Dendrothele bispora (strain CBS 962.96) TaxID=1314807 RepID=A0A4V4HET7_DENBC|nr:hypothetical protein K435DRAFT_210895 [Dendrothele bispora CBS 962.96]